MMSEPWEIFQRAWEHGFNIGYLQGYIPFIFTPRGLNWRTCTKNYQAKAFLTGT